MAAAAAAALKKFIKKCSRLLSRRGQREECGSGGGGGPQVGEGGSAGFILSWSTSILKKCRLKRLFFMRKSLVSCEGTKSAVKNLIYWSDWKGTEGKKSFK